MSCTQIFRIYQYAILIGILLPFIMRYSYIQADSCIFIWHQRQGIIYDNDTTLHTCIGRYRPYGIVQNIGEDINHIGTRASTCISNNQIYRYILIVDGYLFGNLFTSECTCTHSGVTLHILRYIHIEVTLLIGLAQFRLILIRLYPYSRADTFFLLIHHPTIYANHVREGDIYPATFSRREGCHIHECHLADATIILGFHRDAESSIGRNFMRIISI